MSRTYKDKPYKLKHEPWDKDVFLVQDSNYRYYYNFLWTKTTKTKKRKEVDTENHWMSTPSAWIRLMMNRPQRRKGSLWEREVVKSQIANLEEVDKPSVSRKPHVYYW